MVSRVFLRHSSRDSRQAMAVKKWLTEQDPGLAEEIFLDLDPTLASGCTSSAATTGADSCAMTGAGAWRA